MARLVLPDARCESNQRTAKFVPITHFDNGGAGLCKIEPVSDIMQV